MLKLIFEGTLITSKSPTEIVIQEDGLLGVSNEGTILFIDTVSSLPALKKQYSFEHVQVCILLTDFQVTKLSEQQFLMPGFVDTHIHAPQYVYTGTGYDKPLLDWLNTYTFPREAEFKEETYAKSSYQKVVKRSLYCGTTTACYFGTIHTKACQILSDCLHEVGQRAFVGKVNMDRNSPDYYIESTEQSIEATKEFVHYIHKTLKSQLIHAVITPRFVPTCTPELMQFLGDFAEQHNLLIQSHISENKEEIEWVKALHPECQHYAQVYKVFNLLNHRTLMAHCIHLTKEERDLFKELEVGVAHCPNSNFSLQSGVCDVRQLFEEGIDKIGLGTDVGGGYSPCILDAMRHAATASKMNAFYKQTSSALTLSELVYLATLGGAKVLNLQDKIGSFEVGKAFDALLVQVEMDHADEGHKNIHVFDHDDKQSMLEKFVYLGDDRNILSVFVQGVKVK